MKNQLTAFLLVSALLLTMTACSTANAVQKLDAAEDQIEARLEAAEDQLEGSLRDALSPAPTSAPMPPAAEPTQTPPPDAEGPQTLTREQAQKIALDHAGFTAEQVKQLHTEYEIDDGIPQFDVEFHQGDWEYEFEIHAETGKILSYDKDHKHD